MQKGTKEQSKDDYYYLNQPSPQNEKQMSAKFENHDNLEGKKLERNLDVVTEKVSWTT